MKYSICITHKNNFNTVESALESVLQQVDERFEVIVVDSKSTDGSQEKLRRYSDQGKIRLIVAGCSRGKGRQIAFESSAGDYVISNIDMDEVYRPRLRELLEFYHARCEGRVLLSALDKTKELWGYQNVTVTSRKTAASIGGWHDLQYGEDWEFWARAASRGEYSWTVFPLITYLNRHDERTTALARATYRVVRYRDAIRAGRRVFQPGEEVTAAQRVSYWLVACIAPFYPSYGNPFNRTFDCHDRSYFVE